MTAPLAGSGVMHDPRLETSSAGTPVLYGIGRILVRAALWMYFRKVEVTGHDNVSSRGPVILAANHPQSITDALILGVATGRTVHFLAHGGLYHNRVRAFFLRHAGVIPVHRPSDDASAGTHNVRTFAACTQLLARGGCIGIFPEGTSREEPRLQSLRTGTARIALEAEAAHGFALGVRIVPVGLNFESARHYRSRVLVSLGEPLDAREYRAAHDEDPQAAVRLLTASLGDRIRSQVLHVERSGLVELVRDIDRIYREDLLEREHIFRAQMSRFHRRQTVVREIAQAVDYFFENDPEVIWRIDVLLRRYRRGLDRCQVSDAMIRMHEDPAVPNRLFRLALLLLLGLPFAAYGLVFNYIPYRLIGIGVQRLHTNSTKMHWYQLLLGSIVYLAYYPSLLYAAHRAFASDWPRTLGFAASLLPTGLFARWFLYRLAREKRSLRFAWFSAVHRTALSQLRRRRHALIAEMDVHLERYLEAAGIQRDTSAAGTPP